VILVEKYRPQRCGSGDKFLLKDLSANRSISAILIILLLTQLGACASSRVSEGDQNGDEQTRVRSAADPWEPLNRGIYAFNDGLDTITLKPIAKGYKAVTPSFLRTAVANFFANLGTPLVMVNNLLQGKGWDALSDTARLVMNSTVGIGGLFDVATPSGLEKHNEDFGQTLAKWGIKDGPFVMVPLLGPFTLRDVFAVPVNVFLNPLYYYDNASVRDKLYILQAIQQRARLLAGESTIEGSHDPYLTIRESYLQHRAYLVYDGDPPLDDEDELFDELLDEE